MVAYLDAEKIKEFLRVHEKFFSDEGGGAFATSLFRVSPSSQVVNWGE